MWRKRKTENRNGSGSGERDETMKPEDVVEIEVRGNFYDGMLGTIVRVFDRTVLVHVEFGEPFGGTHKVMFFKEEVIMPEEKEG